MPNLLKQIAFLMVLLGAFLLCPSAVSAQAQHSNYCSKTFVTTGDCPESRCYLGCLSGLQYEGCRQECLARPCFEIDSDECPLERCQLQDGCSGEKQCYYQTDRPADDCGDLAYPGQEVSCCEGLNRRCGMEFFDGSCDWEGQYSVYSVPVCLPCGNGVCNQFEDPCNCPEDCPPTGGLDMKTRLEKAIFVKPDISEKDLQEPPASSEISPVSE